MKTKQKILTTLLCVVGLVSATFVLAQATGLRRAVVERADISVPNREAVVVRIELDAGHMAGKHSHPGEEITYVMEGEGELLVDGEAPRKLKVGDAFIIPAGKAHDAKNTGTGTMKLVGTFIVEKGKPLASPAK